MKFSIYYISLFFIFCCCSTLKAQENDCLNLFVDLSKSKDSIFISPTLELNGNCCIQDDTLACVQLQVLFSENASGFRFLHSENDGKYLINCEIEAQLGNVFCLDGAFGIYSLTFCSNDTSLMQFELESIPQLEYDVHFSPPLDNDFGVATLLIDTSLVSSITFDNGETGITAYQLTPGLHDVEIIDLNGCVQGITFNMPCFIEHSEIPGVPFCEPEGNIFDVNTEFPSYEIVDARGSTVKGSIPIDSLNKLFLVSQEECWIPLDIKFDPKPVVNIEAVEFCNDVPKSLGATQGYISYYWSTGETSPRISINQKGIYSVTVTNVNGCMGKDTFKVSEESLEVLIIGDTFCDEEYGTLTALPGNLNYLWSTDEVTQEIQIKEEGNYAVTVTNDEGCFGEALINIKPLDSPDFNLVSDIDCETGLTFITSDQTYRDYLWSTGETSDTIIAQTPGTYQLNVRDDNGCESIDSIEINSIIKETLLSYDCKESFEKLLSVDVNFADSSQFSWSNGSEGDSTIVDAPGLYHITATSEDGCMRVDSVFVTSVDSIKGTVEILYLDDNEVSVQANVNGGVGPYIFSWSTGEENNTGYINNLENGEYSLTVSDETGCSIIIEFTIDT